LFDVEQYFETIDDVIRTSSHISNLVQNELVVQGEWDSWRIITWKVELNFYSGHKLKGHEYYLRESGGKVKKEINHHLMDDQGRFVFRFCTHGNTLSFEEPCHLHVFDDETRLEEGAAILRGYSLLSTNFLEVFRLIYCVIKGEKLPWL
jgi:hypothetical protein